MYAGSNFSNNSKCSFTDPVYLVKSSNNASYPINSSKNLSSINLRSNSSNNSYDSLTSTNLCKFPKIKRIIRSIGIKIKFR